MSWSIRVGVGNRPAVARPMSEPSVGTASTACHSASADLGHWRRSASDAAGPPKRPRHSERSRHQSTRSRPSGVFAHRRDRPDVFGPSADLHRTQNTRRPIDIFMVTPSGLPVLVECKLWRNPEGRREVIGQILDYAKELSRWSSSDLAPTSIPPSRVHFQRHAFPRASHCHRPVHVNCTHAATGGRVAPTEPVARLPRKAKNINNIYKPRRGLNDISVLSKTYTKGPSD
jgi:hypothetical protein